MNEIYEVNDKNSEVTVSCSITEYNARVVTPINDRILLLNISGNIYRGYYSVKKQTWYFENGEPIDEDSIISFFDMPVPKFYRK